MRTFGRRMHGKARLEFTQSARPVQRLEAMNLGEVVPLTAEEARTYQVRDVHGRVLDGVYAAPVACGEGTTAVGSRMLSLSKRPFGSCDLVCSGDAVADQCVADACGGGTLVGSERLRPQSKRASAVASFEHEVASWHRPRVLAARAALAFAGPWLRASRTSSGVRVEGA